MYCKKCRYHAHDHVSTCPKCGADWEESRKALHLNWISSSGFNWLAPDSQTARPKSITTPAFAAATATEELVLENVDASVDAESIVVPPAPNPVQLDDKDIEISIFPDLDFTMSDATAETSGTTQPGTITPQKAGDGFFPGTPGADDTVELDFSPSFDAPPPPVAPKKPMPASPKREDLFINELEEMLSPLAEDQVSQNAGNKKSIPAKDDGEFLDFGSDFKKNS